MIKHMSDAGNVGAGLSFGGGLMLWFGENATAIGAIIVVATFILTAIFYTLNLLINIKRLKLEEKKAMKDEE